MPQISDAPAVENPRNQSEPKRELRTWTDLSGRFSVVAEIVSANKETVTLRKSSGQTLKVLIKRLSEGDRAYAAYFAAKKHNPKAKLILGFTHDVLDGDTLQVDDLFGKRWSVRLEGIDAPENAQPYGLDSRMALRRKDTIVYITESGKKYHRSGCRYLSKSKIPIPLRRARSAHDACKVCRPQG